MLSAATTQPGVADRQREVLESSAKCCIIIQQSIIKNKKKEKGLSIDARINNTSNNMYMYISIYLSIYLDGATRAMHGFYCTCAYN